MHHITDIDLILSFSHLIFEISVDLADEFFETLVCQLFFEHFLEDTQDDSELHRLVFRQLHADSKQLTVGFLADTVDEGFVVIV
jgi:hypothetical protein